MGNSNIVIKDGTHFISLPTHSRYCRLIVTHTLGSNLPWNNIIDKVKTRLILVMLVKNKKEQYNDTLVCF